MKKRLALLGATLAFAGLAVPSLTFASSLTSSQVQAIVSLLQSFGADSSTIATVEAALTGTPTPPASNCVDLSQDLTLGSTDAATGGSVTKLQSFLQAQGYFTYQGAKGYYGFITAQAVGQYQMAKGLVSSSNDSAYGIVGPQTRASMSCGSQPQPNVVTFNAAPTSGNAPLTVTFSGSVPGSGYSLDFGDGTPASGAEMNCDPVPAGSSSATCGPMPVSSTHVYATPGTYTATVSGDNQSSSVTITVTGSQNQPTATIDQSSLTAPSNTPFTLTGTATGVASVKIAIGNRNGTNYFTSAVIPVTNGQWQATDHMGLSSGTYGIDIIGYTDAAGTQPVTGVGEGGLITGAYNLTVTGSQNQPTATINQSSLTATAVNNTDSITLSGTVLGTSQLCVYVGTGSAPQSWQQGSAFDPAQVIQTCNSGSSTIPKVSNGSWSVPLANLSAGTYTVALYDGAPGSSDYGKSLASGVLTVTQGTCSSGSGASCTPPPTCSITVNPTPSVIGQETTINVSSANTQGAQWVHNSDYTTLESHLGSVVPTGGFIKDSFLGVTPGTYNLSVLFTGTNGQTTTCSFALQLVTGSQALSPDGSTLLPGTNGSLTTADGTWTFGNQTQPAGSEILLNGASAANGWGTKLIVANSGTLYTLNSYGMWWKWQNGGWQELSQAPVPGSQPVLPAAAVNFPGPGATVDLSGTQFDKTDALPSSQAFTVAAWVDFTGNSCGVVLSDATNAVGNDMFFGVDGTHAYIRADKSGAALMGNGCLAGYPIALPSNISGSWHHLTWVNSGTESQVYLDGTLAGTVMLSGSNVGYQNSQTAIGAFWDGADGFFPNGASFFHGSLASVQYYTSALTASQVVALYKSSPNPGSSSQTASVLEAVRTVLQQIEKLLH